MLSGMLNFKVIFKGQTIRIVYVNIYFYLFYFIVNKMKSENSSAVLKIIIRFYYLL